MAVLERTHATGNHVNVGSLGLEVSLRWEALGFTTKMVHANKIELHVAEAGAGEPVLLLHGYPQSGEIWRDIAPQLAAKRRVIVADLRGMGMSEIAQSGYDLSNVAEDLHQLVQALSITGKVNVVGHDWGAAVGAVYALRYRQEVKSLSFLESVLPGEGFETMWNFSQPNPMFTFVPFLLLGDGDQESDITADLVRGREELFLHHLWESFTGDKDAAPFSAWSPYVQAMERPGLPTSSASYYREVYRSAIEIRDLVASKLDIPVLSIAGEKGIGEKQREYVENFATNLQDHLVIPGAGHFVAEERPKEVVNAIEAFLDG